MDGAAEPSFWASIAKSLREWRVVWVLALCGLLCRVLPEAVSYYVAGHSFSCEDCTSVGLLLIDIIEKIGEALIIASLLALTVDTYLKKKIVEEVSSFIRGAHLPIEMRREIDQIVQTKLYRTDYEQNFEFIEEPDGDLVKLKRTISFFMNNPLNSDKEHRHYVTLPSLPGRLAEITRAGASGILNTKGEIGDFDDPQPEVKVEDGKLQWQSNCLIPANSIGRARFWNETIQTLDKTDDLTSYSTQATVRYRISIKYPTNFDVDVHFGYHDQKAIKKFPEKRPTIWSLSGALLPMSAVTISWNKRPPTTIEGDTSVPKS